MNHALRILLLLAVPALSARASSEFQYKIPDGWADVMSPGFAADNVPQRLMNSAASGKFAFYAIDPTRATRADVPVSLNVVEAAGSGPISLAVVQHEAEEVSKKLSRMGSKVNVEEVKVMKLNDVDIGYVSFSVTTQTYPVRLVQYTIPGKTKIAVMTYVCPLDDSDHYRPIFESSAMGTIGAYEHSGFGSFFFTGFDQGFSGKRAWVSSVLAALLGAIVLMVNASRNKPKTTLGQSPSTPTAWDCPTCKRRVPVRVNQCRCGTPQPA